MSNTLNTPVEALELEFPLRVVRYAIRRGSGGAGAPARRRRRRARARGARADDLLAASPSAAATRRRAPTAASRARAGATCSTASSSGRRPAGTLRGRRAAGDRDARAAAACGTPRGRVGPVEEKVEQCTAWTRSATVAAWMATAALAVAAPSRVGGSGLDRAARPHRLRRQRLGAGRRDERRRRRGRGRGSARAARASSRRPSLRAGGQRTSRRRSTLGPAGLAVARHAAGRDRRRRQRDRGLAAARRLTLEHDRPGRDPAGRRLVRRAGDPVGDGLGVRSTRRSR